MLLRNTPRDTPARRASELSLVAECKPGEELERALTDVEADIVLWDLGPGPSVDVETLERFIQSYGLSVVALVDGARASGEALAAGARGVLLREADPDRFVAALVSVAGGLIALDPALVSPLLRAGPTLVGARFESLTERETEVLQLLAQGLANKTIAERLQISEHTVKFHVNSILGKLGAQNRTDALVKAVRSGLIVL